MYMQFDDCDKSHNNKGIEFECHTNRFLYILPLRLGFWQIFGHNMFAAELTFLQPETLNDSFYSCQIEGMRLWASRKFLDWNFGLMFQPVCQFAHVKQKFAMEAAVEKKVGKEVYLKGKVNEKQVSSWSIIWKTKNLSKVVFTG